MIPVIDSRTIHELKLPYSKKEIKLKPYKTAQEQILLETISDTKDRKGWLTNIKQIMKENAGSEFDLEKLHVIDFIFLCIKLRGISKGKEFEYTFPCSGSLEDGSACKHLFKESDSIDSLFMIKNSDVTKVMCELNDSISIELVPPKMDYLDYLCSLPAQVEAEPEDVEFINTKNNLNVFINQIAYSVSKVFVKQADGKPKLYSDFTPEEVRENVILNLTIPELRALYDAKQSLINACVRIRKVCPKCKKVFEKVETNFFAYVA